MYCVILHIFVSSWCFSVLVLWIFWVILLVLPLVWRLLVVGIWLGLMWLPHELSGILPVWFWFMYCRSLALPGLEFCVGDQCAGPFLSIINVSTPITMSFYGFDMHNILVALKDPITMIFYGFDMHNIMVALKDRLEIVIASRAFTYILAAIRKFYLVFIIRLNDWNHFFIDRKDFWEFLHLSWKTELNAIIMSFLFWVLLTHRLSLFLISFCNRRERNHWLIESDPPFTECFSEIFSESRKIRNHEDEGLGESEPPLIDLENLRGKNEKERQACIESITKASLQWGFFQVVNHGISHELLAQMRREQKKIFEIPFEKKVNSRFLNDCYRWGTPTATSLEQFSWSEAFQFPIGNISGEDCFSREFSSLREVMEKLANAMSELAGILAKILAENLGYRGHSFPENSSKNTCFLRLNHYPKCTFSPKTFGLTPHTDSDFLTILHQDEVGGLHMMKDFKWVAVKPNPNALIVNIGDLFQVTNMLPYA
ncbi:Gibberellin 2-beta-dioxygenase 8 [Dendrobium catenatum]|uniref:Gibberellin 2-beta-dioxygenase 8 n=1 Tax=Dendrobium catenatum TaxID=906689 RepID=A0A2I0V868_9ASPA|nr:Gibberellin 2-beta-dioxygenase 8 [Dendrobium catenatum]